MDWIGPKWIESDRMHWIGPNGLNQTETDWNLNLKSEIANAWRLTLQKMLKLAKKLLKLKIGMFWTRMKFDLKIRRENLTKERVRFWPNYGLLMTQMDQNDHFCMPGMLGHVSDLCLRQKTGVSWSLRPKFDMKKVKNEFVFCFEMVQKDLEMVQKHLKTTKSRQFTSLGT